MVRKGNLLYNGDFETGTLENWEHGAYGLPAQCIFGVSIVDKYRGNYSGEFQAFENYAESYVAYDRVCSFEEYEAFLYIIYAKKSYGLYARPVLYGLDDKGNLIKTIALSWLTENDVWKRNLVLIRQFGDITHFKVGYHYKAVAAGDYCFIDEAKLLGYKSIKSLILNDSVYKENVTSNTYYNFSLGCFGRCKIVSIIKVEDVSGTDPTLDVKLSACLLDDSTICIDTSHGTITSAGTYVLETEFPEISWLHADYNVGGTSPSFTFKHVIRVYPLADAGYSVGSGGTAL